MGNYNSQYKKYYQNLQNKNMKKNNSPVYTRDSFEEVYGYKDTNRNKSKKKDFFEIINTINSKMQYFLKIIYFGPIRIKKY